jgi:hypothetical protein
MTAVVGASLAWVAAWCYRAYFATLRTRALLPDGSLIAPRDYPYGRQIFALCERDALALGGILTGRRFAVLVAHGRDGDLAAAVLAALGCRVVRGSSARGGAGALRALVPLLDQTLEPLGLVVDGPPGRSVRSARPRDTRLSFRARGPASTCPCHTPASSSSSTTSTFTPSRSRRRSR